MNLEELIAELRQQEDIILLLEGRLNAELHKHRLTLIALRAELGGKLEHRGLHVVEEPHAAVHG